MLTNRIPFALVLVLALIAACSFGLTVAHSEVNFNEQTQTQNYQTFNFFSATTTSANSTAGGGGALKIAGAKKVTFYLTHGGTATTSTTGAVFSVQTSRDGTNWLAFNKLIGSDVASTATSTYTLQGATSTVAVSMNLANDTFLLVRCLSTEMAAPLGTDGEQSCLGAVEF